MNIKEVKISDIKAYNKNAKKHNDDQVKAIAKSIKKFGFRQPLVIDKNNEIVVGHGRYLAAVQLGIEAVPCEYADDLTDDEIKAYRLADNKLNESPWDFQLVDEELEAIKNLNLDFDMSDFGFDLSNLSVENPADGSKDSGNTYTKKIEGLQYEPSAEKPLLSDLFDKQKTNELIDKIKAANVSDEEKDFLITAASRHTVFNYAKIADYYAHADAEMQSLMEQSALVIIDFEDAIKNGYARLSDEIATMYMEDTES